MARSAESRESLLRFLQATNGPIIAIISTNFASFFFQTRHALRPPTANYLVKSGLITGFSRNKDRSEKQMQFVE